MKIAIIGYGKMGKIIEDLAINRGHLISHKITSQNSNESWESADVAIEFSKPEAAVTNIIRSIDYGVPIAIGTTGWYDHISEVCDYAMAKNGAIFYTSNFSLGVNIFSHLVAQLSRIMNSYKDYKATMEEIHHTQKLDSPSGTAISLAHEIIKVHSNYSSWVNSESSSEKELPIISKREGDVKGTHIIQFESDIDKITVKHEAKNRKGFALGAILAAEFLKNKKGVYTMNDLINF